MENTCMIFIKKHTQLGMAQRTFKTSKKEGIICFLLLDKTAVDLLESLDNPIYKYIV